MYNFSLAVLASSMMLRSRTHSMEECIEKIYSPTDKLFKNNPSSVLLFSGPIYRPKYPSERGISQNECSDLYAIIDDNVVYVGTVVNIYLAITVFDYIVEIFLDEIEKKSFNQEIFSLLEKLRDFIKKGPLSIKRRNIRCYIPVVSEKIRKREKEKAFKRFIYSLFPELKNISFSWLSREKERILLKEINKQTEKKLKKMKPQEKEEREKIFRNEFGVS